MRRLTKNELFEISASVGAEVHARGARIPDVFLDRVVDVVIERLREFGISDTTIYRALLMRTDQAKAKE